MVPKWSEKIVSLMSLGNFKQVSAIYVENSNPYSLLAGRLYKKMDNKVLNLYIEPEEIYLYFHQAYIATRGLIFSRDETLWRLKHFGVFWPTMGASVNILVKQCEKCHKNHHNNMPHCSK